jgi:hypothetical protein
MGDKTGVAEAEWGFAGRQANGTFLRLSDYLVRPNEMFGPQVSAMPVGWQLTARVRTRPVTRLGLSLARSTPETITSTHTWNWRQ